MCHVSATQAQCGDFFNQIDPDTIAAHARDVILGHLRHLLAVK
jgi:hypothetical protein